MRFRLRLWEARRAATYAVNRSGVPRRRARTRYLMTPEHTAQAREALGVGPLLAPQLKVILETDPPRARTTTRTYLSFHLDLLNYTNTFLRLGFTESDLAAAGSDRLIDAVYAWGDENRIRSRVNEFHAAGAGHAALQVLDEGTGDALPRSLRDPSVVLNVPLVDVVVRVAPQYADGRPAQCSCHRYGRSGTAVHPVR